MNYKSKEYKFRTDEFIDDIIKNQLSKRDITEEELINEILVKGVCNDFYEKSYEKIAKEVEDIKKDIMYFKALFKHNNIEIKVVRKGKG